MTKIDNFALNIIVTQVGYEVISFSVALCIETNEVSLWITQLFGKTYPQRILGPLFLQVKITNKLY
jgi:hypothetical protein